MTWSRAPALRAALVLAAVAGGCRGPDAEPPAPAPEPGAATRPPAASAPRSGDWKARYVDATAAAGLDAVTWCGSPSKDHLLESVGSGAAFCDLDGDGRDDVFVLDAWKLADSGPGMEPREVLSRGSFAFYRNQGDGTFADETERARLGGGGSWATGVAAGDVDGDGDVDLHVTCFGPDLLFRNRGDGSFDEVAAQAGVADPGWGGGSAFFDADADGDLDLYVANYIAATFEQVLSARRTLRYKGQVEVMAGPFGLPGEVDQFYRNRGDGTFEEAGEELGLVDRGEAYGLGVLPADFDADGDVDLFVANDSNPNYLFRNESAGRFSEVAVVSGAAFDEKGAAQAGMGVATFDHDADGVLDIFLTTFADDGSTLFEGEGKLFFHDASRAAGVHEPTYAPLSWGVEPVDFDRDGVVDLVVANGQIYPQVDGMRDTMPYRQHAQVLRNTGGKFEDVTSRAGPGLEIAGSYRGLAVGDVDGDGGPDVLLTRIDEPALLLRHEGDDRSRTIVVAPDAPAPAWFGARIDVTAEGRTQTRVILSGGSFASQSTLRPSFALGPGSGTAHVLVRFLGGEKREFPGVIGGTVVTVDVPRRSTRPASVGR